MRSLLLLSALSLFAVTATAQMTLTKADYERFYNSESVETYTAVLDQNTTMHVGTTGGGNEYDLNSFTFEKDNSVCNYVDPSQTLVSASFPNATHALCHKSNNVTGLTFYKLTDDAVYLEGTASIVDGMPFVHSSGKSRPVIEFPAQVSTLWDYVGDVINVDPGTSTQAISHYVFDGNGTLQLGFEQVPCLRLKIVDEQINETNIMGTITRSVKRSISYMFVTEQGLIVNAQIDTLDEFSEDPRLISLNYVMHIAGPVSNDVVASPLALSLHQNYPNPVSTSTGFQTTVEWNSETAGFASVALYDVTGRERAHVYEGSTLAGVNRATMDASNLEPGTYMLRLNQGGEVRTRLVSIVK